jgi:hypothetical protein
VIVDELNHWVSETMSRLSVALRYRDMTFRRLYPFWAYHSLGMGLVPDTIGAHYDIDK